MDAMTKYSKDKAVGKRSKRVYILIVCEGEKTEPNYFKGFDLRYKFVHDLDEPTVTVKGEGKNTKSLVDQALYYAQESLSVGSRVHYDELYIVFDKDSFPSDQFNSAILNCKDILIKKHQVKVSPIWTNEAFELWYLLHFEYLNSGISRDQYIDKLSKIYENKKVPLNTYQKNQPNIRRNVLLKYGDEAMAIKWAKKLHQSHEGRSDYGNLKPCTMVYQLVERLLELEKVGA